jgi:hypothetical protein
MGIESLWKIETRLEYGQQLLRKLINTITGAKLLHVHSVSPFSRQPLIPSESSFDFRTSSTPINLSKGRKRSSAGIGDGNIPRLDFSHAPAGA